MSGLVKASTAWREFGGRLPWATRASFYMAIARGELPCVRFGSAVFIARSTMEALANGDVEALQRDRSVESGKVNERTA